MILQSEAENDVVVLMCSGKMFTNGRVLIDDEKNEMVPTLELVYFLEEIDCDVEEVPDTVAVFSSLQIPMSMGVLVHFEKFIKHLKEGEPQTILDGTTCLSFGNGNVYINFAERYNLGWVNNFERGVNSLRAILEKIERDKND